METERRQKQLKSLIGNQYQLFWTCFILGCDALCELWEPVWAVARNSNELAEDVDWVRRVVDFAQNAQNFDNLTKQDLRYDQIPPGYYWLISSAEETKPGDFANANQLVRRRIDCLQSAIRQLVELVELHGSHTPEPCPVRASHNVRGSARLLGDRISDSILPLDAFGNNGQSYGPGRDLLHRIARALAHLNLATDMVKVLEDAVRWHLDLSRDVLRIPKPPGSDLPTDLEVGHKPEDEDTMPTHAGECLDAVETELVKKRLLLARYRFLKARTHASFIKNTGGHDELWDKPASERDTAYLHRGWKALQSELAKIGCAHSVSLTREAVQLNTK